MVTETTAATPAKKHIKKVIPSIAVITAIPIPNRPCIPSDHT